MMKVSSPARGLGLTSWIDWRAMFLALGFALAASLPLITTLKERREFYLFEVTLSSNTSGLTRVLWDEGRGYNEHDSSAQPLKADPRPLRYLYLLPSGKLRGLRFSPIDRVASLTFSNARVIDYRGKLVRAFAPTDFFPGSQIADLRREGSQLTVDTAQEADAPYLDLPLEDPLELPLKSGVLVRTVAPVFIPVWLLGGLLSSPRLLSRAARKANLLAQWARQNPAKAILIAAGLAVALQAYPVVFLGRSFVSPNNGSSMLYGHMPTLPGYSDPSLSNTMGSDVGALFFHHLYTPMVQREALWRDGELPLWNRYNLAGTPLLGQGLSMFGDPFNLITIVANGAGWAWDLRFVLAHFLFAAGVSLCVHRLTKNLAASLLVALAAPFIGYFQFRINHPANFGVCYGPWIVWAWIGYIQAESRRAEASWLAALIGVNWTVMTSGTVKEAYMIMACLNLAGIILLLLLPQSRGRRVRLAGYAVVMGLFFILISAPLWGSFLVTLGRAFTTSDQPAAQTLSSTHLIGFFEEMFYREGSVDERVVAPALNGFFLLGVAWWLSNPILWIRDRAGLALLIGAALPLSLVFGLIPASVIVQIPFLRNIYHIGNTFSCPAMPLVMLLAGCGFHDAIKRWRGGQAIGFQIGVALALVATLVAIYFSHSRGQTNSLFFWGYVGALGFAVAALPLGWWWSARAHRPALLAVALGLALPLLLWRYGQYTRSRFNLYVFTPGVRVDFFSPSEAVAQLNRARGTEPIRVTGLQFNLFPTYNVALGWESLYGVDALRIGTYDALVNGFNLVQLRDWGKPAAPEAVAAQRPLYDLLNVGYYLADHGTPASSLPDLVPVAQEDLDVFMSPSAWPRAFFSDQLTGYRSIEDFAAKLRQGDGKPFAAVEQGQPELGQLPAQLAGRTIKAATEYRLTSNTTSFVIDAPKAGVAVLSETYLPKDFAVTVNEKPATYFRVNHTFKGVLLPTPGRYRITFAYRPEHFQLMLGLSVAGLGLASAAGLAIVRGSQLSSPRDDLGANTEIGPH